MTKLLVRVVLPVLAGVVLLAGCTTTREGTASPAQTSPGGGTSAPETSSAAGGGSTKSITDPCSLLPASGLSGYGQFDPPDSKNIGTARSCSYQKTIASASDHTMSIGVNVRDDASVDQVRDTGGGVVDKDINGRHAKEAPDGSAVACTLGLPVGSSSRVDVAVLLDTSADQACQIAEEVATKVVEPKLPKA
jgi:hypothetical protein